MKEWARGQRVRRALYEQGPRGLPHVFQEADGEKR